MYVVKPVISTKSWAKIAARKPKRGPNKKTGGMGSRRKQDGNTGSDKSDDIGQPGSSGGAKGSCNTGSKPAGPPLQVSEPPNIEPNKVKSSSVEICN